MEKIKDVKIAMIVSAGKTIDYLKDNKNAIAEEIMAHVMREVYAEGKAKRAAIASANFVINYKRKNLSASQKEIFHNLFDNTETILSSIESDNY